MKKFLVIAIGLMLSFGAMAQNKNKAKDVSIEFKNMQKPTSTVTYMVVNANYPSSRPYIPSSWFFENPNATRNIMGQIEWRSRATGQLIATQEFYKPNVNYYDLPEGATYRVVEINLGDLQAVHVVGPLQN